MRIVMTGSSGLIGNALTAALVRAGHVLTWFKRDPRYAAAAGHAYWDPQAGKVPVDRLEGEDAVVHLAGESIGEGRWTAERKKGIRESRVRGTTAISQALAGLESGPRVLLSASAIGIYGARDPDEPLDESSAPGEGFLAEVAQAWEAATAPAAQAGARVVNMRFGIVLSPEGGALARLLPIFRMGLGGRLGSGRQVWSWIALDDLVGAALHVLSAASVSGPINFTSPNPATNAQLTQALARALGRPAPFPVPALALRVALGEMAEPLLLTGARVLPRKLLESGYNFSFPELEPALRTMLARAV